MLSGWVSFQQGIFQQCFLVTERKIHLALQSQSCEQDLLWVCVQSRMGIFHCCAHYTGTAISVIVDFSFTFKATTKPLGKIQIEELCFELSQILCFK